MAHYDTAESRETFTHNGRRFEMAIFTDDTSDPPWKRSDGHGPCRWISDRERMEPGETVLWDTRDGRYVYNRGAAIVQAARESWGLCDKKMVRLVSRLGKKPTRAQIRYAAVLADMEFLRGWCADDWHYVGVGVRILDPHGDPIGEDYDNAIWGIESSAGEYLQETAAELAGEILRIRGNAWRAALSERRQVKYWEARGVPTVGA
jgi:hypothetical protein